MKITDKMRLDWLQRNKALLDASCHPLSWTCVQSNRADGAGQGVRAAIDAAIRAERKRSRR